MFLKECIKITFLKIYLFCIYLVDTEKESMLASFLSINFIHWCDLKGGNISETKNIFNNKTLHFQCDRNTKLRKTQLIYLSYWLNHASCLTRCNQKSTTNNIFIGIG